MVIVRPNPAPRERPGRGVCGPFSGRPLTGLRRWHVAHGANFGAAGAGLRERPHDAVGWYGHRRSPLAPAVTHDGQNRCLGRRRQMGPTGDDGAQVGVLGSQCRRVTPTSTPTCCVISGFTRGIRRWPPDCKSAIVGSTPTGASFFSLVPPQVGPQHSGRVARHGLKHPPAPRLSGERHRFSPAFAPRRPPPRKKPRS